MWVEPDTNMPTGESLRPPAPLRPALFRAHLRPAPHASAGCPTASASRRRLPQLLRQAGVDSFFTIKVNWSETNRFPFDLFWWEGLDGSRVLAHTFDNPVGGYNGRLGPRAAIETWRNFRGKVHARREPAVLRPGDGGGGPTEEMLERQRQLADFPAIPAMRPVAVAGLVRRARTMCPARADLPIWVGEIYLELHRGTLTTQGRTKYLHRRAERALITAETLSEHGRALRGAGGRRRWRRTGAIVLRNEFHDILPGSSIREVYERRGERSWPTWSRPGARQQEAHLAALAERLGLTGRQAGTCWWSIPTFAAAAARRRDGRRLPGSQTVEDGHASCRHERPGLSALALAPLRRQPA